ncbi:MAG TPA: 6-phosphofructokinase [Candidatus Binataceae bacterium]|nr:6-phosphofructokinase [Candidatus Binataceae bacterium]
MDEEAKQTAAETPPPRIARPRRIAVLTAGGDAPGMNAAIRSVVRVAGAANIEVLGVQRGFEGLVFGNFIPLPSRAVANMVQRGGTILETSRSDRFRTPDGRARAAENLHYRDTHSLVIIGGDGTLQGARALAEETDIQVMFIPASIDNDVPGSEFSIGFDTAVNTALEAIDRIRDTAFAYERPFFIEVMGRDSGFIALAVAIAGGAEAVIVPEMEVDVNDLIRRIEESQARGKRSQIVVVSEGPRTGGALALANAVNARLGVQARVVVLGHIQRGGSPTARDRLLASRMGAGAVKAIVDGHASSLVAELRGEISFVPLPEVPAKSRQLDTDLLDLVAMLSL